jgi:hypothetical protein
MAVTLRATPYRDGNKVLEARRDLLIQRARRDVECVPVAIESTYTGRVSRTVAGYVGVVGALVMLGAATGQIFVHGVGAWGPTAAALEVGSPTWVLVITLVAVAVTYVVTQLVAQHRLVAWYRRELSATHDVAGDIARLGRFSARGVLLERARALERRSVAAPLAAAGVLAPLSLHLAVAAVTGRPGYHLTDFDSWIRLSVVFVLPAHIAAAWCAHSFARDLAKATDLRCARRHAGWHAWGVVCAAGLAPGGPLVIPTLLVMATGLFIPPLYAGARNRVAVERMVLTAPTA